MPMHDWTRVDARAFHDFRRLWVAQLTAILNGGLLPAEIKALPDADAGAITVRHEAGTRDLARIEIVSPAVKADAAALDAFVANARDLLARRTHLLLIDVFPPGPHDPNGVHALIWKSVSPDPFTVPSGRPLVFAAYESDRGVRVYLQALAVGDVLPPVPLFVSPGACLELPLETGYEAAFGKLKLPSPA